MGTIARLPCDEAAILAGSCQMPAATNGTWILAATILGSSIRAWCHWWHSRERRASSAAIGPACHPCGRPMGSGILRSVPGYAAPRRRVFRGHLWPPQDLRGRGNTLLLSLGFVRTRARHRVAYCCQGFQGPSRPGTGGACTNQGPAIQTSGRRDDWCSWPAGYRGCIRRGLSHSIVDSGWAGARQFFERCSAHQKTTTTASMN